MIARHEADMDNKTDIWSKLAAPLPPGVISWRQDGKSIHRDGRYLARFVAYIDANTVRERLDSVVPGEWDLTLDLLPPLPGDEGETNCSFKARLQILGVIREDVGTGRDYKAAATDAFKRAAVRFGIAHELYAYEQNWVQVDGEGRYARPLEDPQAAYTRRYGARSAGSDTPVQIDSTTLADVQTADGEPTDAPASNGSVDSPSCPKCGGRMWDNRLTKRNPKAPDFKCRDRSCDGVIWPTRAAGQNGRVPAPAVTASEPREAEFALDSSPLSGTDDIPF
jgi:hypothetical protein